MWQLFYLLVGVRNFSHNFFLGLERTPKRTLLSTPRPCSATVSLPSPDATPSRYAAHRLGPRRAHGHDMAMARPDVIYPGRQHLRTCGTRLHAGRDTSPATYHLWRPLRTRSPYSLCCPPSAHARAPQHATAAGAATARAASRSAVGSSVVAMSRRLPCIKPPGPSTGSRQFSTTQPSTVRPTTHDPWHQ